MPENPKEEIARWLEANHRAELKDQAHWEREVRRGAVGAFVTATVLSVAVTALILFVNR